MNNTPTPETDMIIRNAKIADHPPTRLAATLTVKCEKLERERDEAREEIEALRHEYHGAKAMAGGFKDKIKSLREQRDEAREALDRIARPVWWMQEDQKRKTGSINGISGGMALALSEDAEYLKGIAKSALKGKTK